MGKKIVRKIITTIYDDLTSSVDIQEYFNAGNKEEYSCIVKVSPAGLKGGTFLLKAEQSDMIDALRSLGHITAVAGNNTYTLSTNTVAKRRISALTKLYKDLGVKEGDELKVLIKNNIMYIDKQEGN